MAFALCQLLAYPDSSSRKYDHQWCCEENEAKLNKLFKQKSSCWCFSTAFYLGRGKFTGEGKGDGEGS